MNCILICKAYLILKRARCNKRWGPESDYSGLYLQVLETYTSAALKATMLRRGKLRTAFCYGRLDDDKRRGLASFKVVRQTFIFSHDVGEINMSDS